jgi:hypothetical protein
MAHWIYIFSAVGGPLWLAPRAFLMVVGGLTKNQQRFKQCAEMSRLLRRDTKDISNYVTDWPENNKPPPSATNPARGRIEN